LWYSGVIWHGYPVARLADDDPALMLVAIALNSIHSLSFLTGGLRTTQAMIILGLSSIGHI